MDNQIPLSKFSTLEVFTKILQRLKWEKSIGSLRSTLFGSSVNFVSWARFPTSCWKSSKFLLCTRITPSRNLTECPALLWELSPLVPQEEYTCLQLWLEHHLLQRLELWTNNFSMCLLFFLYPRQAKNIMQLLKMIIMIISNCMTKHDDIILSEKEWK